MPDHPSQAPDAESWAIFHRNIAWLSKHYGISRRHMAKLLRISVSALKKMKHGDLPRPTHICCM